MEEKKPVKTDETLQKAPFFSSVKNRPASSGSITKKIISIFKIETPEGKEEINPYVKAFLYTLFLTAVIGIIVFSVRWLFPDLYDWLQELIKHNEIILVIVLALIGIYYAMKAMLEAAAALKESQKIYTAISSFFDNYDQATGRIESIIGEAENELLILVSLPAYGLIVDKELGDKFYSEIIKKITNGKTGDFEIKFICFSPTLCERFEDEFKQRNPSRYNTYQVYKEEILRGLHNVKSLRNLQEKSLPNPPKKSYENIWMLSEDTHIRLIIADNKKAFFATVPDFDEQHPEETNIAGFETSEKKMVSILRQLFYEQRKSCSPVSDSDFKSYFSDESQ